jgi:hypothetical protein
VGSRSCAFPLIVVLILLCPIRLAAHGGGLDQFGCHHDRKRGGYHCHRGVFSGQSFNSQVEMLETLEALQNKKDGSSESGSVTSPRSETSRKACIRDRHTGEVKCGEILGQ